MQKFVIYILKNKSVYTNDCLQEDILQLGSHKMTCTNLREDIC